MRLYVFDVDGTLLRTNRLDARCFLKVANDYVDFSGQVPDWNEFEHATAAGIARELLSRAGVDELERTVGEIRSSFLETLEQAVENGEAIGEIEGARRTLQQLENESGVASAIATGDWEPSSKFKLGRAGLPVEDIPFACSDDAVARAEIIETAVDRARRTFDTDFDSIVYVGDGVWDVRAARACEIEFVGVGTGRHAQRLRDAGAETVLSDLAAGNLPRK